MSLHNTTTQTETPVSVLVAEDNPSVREFIVRSLFSNGHQVSAVADGQEALEALSRQKFKVLVTDIVMPNIDGISLAMMAIRQFPDLRIVMISGYAQERMRAHNLDALVHKIIAKPFSLEEICAAVNNALTVPTNAV